MVHNKHITPIMRIDPYGNAWWNPFSWTDETWMKIGSGALIVGGAVCMAIPGAQGAGLVLIGAGVGSVVGGVGSVVGGEVSEAVGGDYLTGWGIGGVLGAFGGAYAATLPGVTSFMSSTLTLGSGGLALAGAGTTGGAIAIATGAQIVGAGALAIGMSIMMFATDPFVESLKRGMSQN